MASSMADDEEEDAAARRSPPLLGGAFADMENADVVAVGDGLVLLFSRTETSVRGRMTVGMILGPRWGPIARGWLGSAAGRIATGIGTTAPTGGGSKRVGGDGRWAAAVTTTMPGLASKSLRSWLSVRLWAPMMLARHSSFATRGFSHTACCCCLEIPFARRCPLHESRKKNEDVSASCVTHYVTKNDQHHKYMTHLKHDKVPVLGQLVAGAEMVFGERPLHPRARRDRDRLGGARHSVGWDELSELVGPERGRARKRRAAPAVS